VNELAALDHVNEVLKARRQDYNHCRPHGSLGHLNPSEFAKRRAGNGSKTPNSSFK